MDLGKIENASTQYNDLVGTAAMDFEGGIDENLEGFAKDYGINCEEFEPIGVSFFVTDAKLLIFDVLCIKRTKPKETKDVTSFSLTLSLEEWLNVMHRFKVILHTRGLSIEDFRVVDMQRKEEPDGEFASFL